jgi:hypothetical protein
MMLMRDGDDYWVSSLFVAAIQLSSQYTTLRALVLNKTGGERQRAAVKAA